MFETTNQIINPIINLTSLLICGLKPFSSPQAWSLSLFQNHLPKHLILESNGPWNIRKVKLTKIAGPDLSHLSPFRHVPPCSAMFRLGISCTICSNSLCASALGRDSFVKIWQWFWQPMGLIGPHRASWVEHEHTVRDQHPPGYGLLVETLEWYEEKGHGHNIYIYMWMDMTWFLHIIHPYSISICICTYEKL